MMILQHYIKGIHDFLWQWIPWDHNPKDVLSYYLVLILLQATEVICQLREAAAPGILTVTTTQTAISSVTSHATFAPSKYFWVANKPCRYPHGFSVLFCLIFIAPSICIGSSQGRLRKPNSSPPPPFWFDFCRVIFRGWWIFASIIAICILIILRCLEISSSRVPPSPSIITLGSPCKCSCGGFCCCSFPAKCLWLSSESLGNWSLDLPCKS